MNRLPLNEALGAFRSLSAAAEPATRRAYDALRDLGSRRPALALAAAALLLVGTVGAVNAEARQRRAAAERRAASAYSSEDARKQADAYRRYQDYEYVKRIGPITGPMYSNKW
jgi:hypothetical protein